MIVEINYLPQWIPNRWNPGTVFVLDKAGESGDEGDPSTGPCSACPSCATLGLITRKQMAGRCSHVICGSERCSAQFSISRRRHHSACRPLIRMTNAFLALPRRLCNSYAVKTWLRC